MDINKLAKEYSFCDPVWPAPRIWHVRKLTKQGRKFGGGADTKALCGSEVGWDVTVTITELNLSKNTCKECLKALEIQEMVALIIHDSSILSLNSIGLMPMTPSKVKSIKQVTCKCGTVGLIATAWLDYTSRFYSIASTKYFELPNRWCIELETKPEVYVCPHCMFLRAYDVLVRVQDAIGGR